jgi:hypothetical protein
MVVVHSCICFLLGLKDIICCEVQCILYIVIYKNWIAEIPYLCYHSQSNNLSTSVRIVIICYLYLLSTMLQHIVNLFLMLGTNTIISIRLQNRRGV